MFANVIFSAALFGLPVFALPAAILAYLMIVVGRRIAGLTGMKIAALGASLFSAVPLALFVPALVSYLLIEGPRYPDQIKGMLIFGSMGINAALGVGVVIFSHWHDQLAKIQAKT